MWKQMLQQLRDANMTWQMIADRCKVSRGTVHDLWTERTKNPRKDVARRLRRLHTEYTKGPTRCTH